MLIEHVNLTVQDLDRSVIFYSELLGFGTRWTGKAIGEEGVVRAAHVGDDHCYLALFEAEKEGRAEAHYGRAGLNHVGFHVDDLAATRERALALGANPHFEPEYEPGKRFYIFDPDGIELELVEYGSAPSKEKE